MNHTRQAQHQLIRHRAKQQLAAHLFDLPGKEEASPQGEEPVRFSPRPLDPEQVERVAWLQKANTEHEHHKLNFVEC